MDLREALNAVSDVILNRPPALREFDQIYMKAADMLIQAEHISKWVNNLDVVFVGDGDALALSLTHLHASEHLHFGPRHIHVLDFDERVVNSVHRFAERYEYADRITASLYNVADALPVEHANKFDAFYTNPPFGASNDGESVLAFLRRGCEASRDTAICCVAIADYDELPWCDVVLKNAQKYLLGKDFAIAEMIPRLHHYHLDDEPALTSCSLVGRRKHVVVERGISRSLTTDERTRFYGKDNPLAVRYIRDKRNGGKLASKDYECVGFEESGE